MGARCSLRARSGTSSWARIYGSRIAGYTSSRASPTSGTSTRSSADLAAHTREPRHHRLHPVQRLALGRCRYQRDEIPVAKGGHEAFELLRTRHAQLPRVVEAQLRRLKQLADQSRDMSMEPGHARELDRVGDL